MPVKKVLIIPGGGVFGVIPSGLLAGFDPDGIVQDRIDAIGGTSIGGILALMYGKATSFKETHKLLLDAIPKVFKSRWWNPGGVFGPRHSPVALEDFLRQHLDLRFGLLTPMIVIPAIHFRDNGNDGYIDGGLFENMTIMTTITAIKSKIGTPFKDMDIFVIGTGKANERTSIKVYDNIVRRDDCNEYAWRIARATSAAPTYFPPYGENVGKLAKWGLKSWGEPLVDMLTGANEMSSQFWANQCGVRNLTVFNPVELDKKMNMNDPSIVGALSEKVDAVQGDFNRLFAKWLA